jgi:hypothetical protein
MKTNSEMEINKKKKKQQDGSMTCGSTTPPPTHGCGCMDLIQ